MTRVAIAYLHLVRGWHRTFGGALNFNKSSAAEMGDRGHNRHGPKRGGVLCPFRGALGTHLIQCGLRGGLYFRTKWRLHPSSRLATIV